ncbi:hypothetical protein HNP77_002099 [Treponema rectale]|uniref:Uncharacterized protein n=1 Tax=Treponema rectale TaxID=744512 RepID=A0A840SD63_9SPIR|nr:hypothetical protein [Treponema rectale]
MENNIPEFRARDWSGCDYKGGKDFTRTSEAEVSCSS